MANVDYLYVSIVRLTQNEGKRRIAALPSDTRIEFGVHGPIADHYGLDRKQLTERAATIDYFVAATAA